MNQTTSLDSDYADDNMQLLTYCIFCVQVFEATVNRGGGAGGAAERKDGKCSFKCYVCLCAQPSEKSLQVKAGSKRKFVADKKSEL